ncbi:hypothetical protein COW81_00435 [Candidatus Campbellbacteria bacterium CG22_combo_CG10-13_8_21_14_all_36_13]|uniref:Uncharacterized protein n=1 Tax=Candidatus Campbellbacteria bacterium CG22_combo_CG10-13_8_21_14_all_36_13 TaxID=1974529 RepID=A0A2H0DZI7_9BACT|nr:MAG: hypothetical protein COW81_00435 [Candidatus Campbellbacteria bacterium CG22_combo_CG10-13_8_21_14_all_36_13]
MEEHNNKTIFITLGVVVALIVFYFFIAKNTQIDTTQEDQQQEQQDVNDVEISLNQVDVENVENEADKLPEGFPTDIPVELSNITESYSTDYKDAGFVQKSLVYTSEKGVAWLFSEYEKFMKDNGYEITDSTTDDGYAYLYGSKEGDDLSLVFEGADGSTIVSVTYLDR